MDAVYLKFASADFLRLIENQGLSGHWSWDLLTGRQIWSPGLFRLFGFESGSVPASYELFRSLVHPEDRASLASAAEVCRDGILRKRDFRVIRPDGQIRALSASNELRVSPDGRPLSVYGTVLDVTDMDRLMRARDIERRHRRALAQQAQVFTFNIRVGERLDFDAHDIGVFACTREEFLADPYKLLAADGRERARALHMHNRALGLPSQGPAEFRMAAGGTAWFQGLEVPIRDGSGAVIGWTGVLRPASAAPVAMSGALCEGLEQSVRGEHLRAARALLDWSMVDLAGASGLSLSTVRRLEEEAAHQTERSRHRVVSALRDAGIRFLVVEGALAVVRG